jgi:hypothetical protein
MINKRRPEFLPVGEALYRQRRGVLIERDCIAGPVPRYMWNRIRGRKRLRALPKVARQFELFP